MNSIPTHSNEPGGLRGFLRQGVGYARSENKFIATLKDDKNLAVLSVEATICGLQVNITFA